MRILFIVHRVPYPPNKGEKIRAFWELRELAREHSVDLFCFYDDPEDEKHFHELRQYCDFVYIERTSLLRSRAQAIGALLLAKPFSVAFFHSSRMRRQIASALRSRCYDRIVVFSSSMAQYARGARHLPRVLDLVDVDSDKWLQYAEHSSWPQSALWRREARLLAEYESSLVRDFSTTVVCTEAESELLRSLAPTGRIEVLQNFLDVDAYDRNQGTIPDFIRAWQPYLIFTGSMDYRPNIDAVQFFCREVFPLIQRDFPEVRLVVAGRNPDRSVLALRGNSVVVTGGVLDMKPYIWGARVAVVPMRIARGVQNKILEALAGGIPVVSTKTAAEALPPALRSLLSIGDTPQQISGAVLRILQGAEVSSENLRSALKNYIEGLGLPSKLHRLVQDPAENAREKTELESTSIVGG